MNFMAIKEIGIPFVEMARLEVYCPKCGAGLLLDVTGGSYGPLEECGACRAQFSDKLKAAIVAYKRFFNEASEVKAKVLFRVQAD